MKNQSLFRLLLLSYILIALVAASVFFSVWLLILLIPAIIGVSVFVSKRITTPLDRLQDIMEQMSEGDFKHQFPWSESFEIKELVTSLHKLNETLSKKIASLSTEIQQKKGILENMKDGVITFDLHEKIIGANKAASQYLGISEEKLIGFSIQEAVRHTELQRFVQQLFVLDNKQEGTIVITDQQNRYLQVQGIPLKQSQESNIGALVVLHDLSPLKHLDAVRKDFVANVSHELKTPITLIQGSLETLDTPNLSVEEQQQFIQIALSHAQRLGQIIEDLLMLARLEQGRHSIDLCLEEPLPVIQKAIATCQPFLDQANMSIHIHAEAQEKISLNKALLEQALINLIQNALKYSEASTLIIENSFTEKDCIITVYDNGKGIGAEHLPRLFERFYRVDPVRNRHSGGTGLGLSIVKHIVLAHHGKIDVQSQPGQGTSFTLTLPKPS